MDTIFTDFAKETPHLTKEQIAAATVYAIIYDSENKTDSSDDSALSKWLGDWENCVMVVEFAYVLNDVYSTITDTLDEVKLILQELTDTYDDYSYYPKVERILFCREFIC